MYVNAMRERHENWWVVRIYGWVFIFTDVFMCMHFYVYALHSWKNVLNILCFCNSLSVYHVFLTFCILFICKVFKLFS